MLEQLTDQTARLCMHAAILDNDPQRLHKLLSEFSPIGGEDDIDVVNTAIDTKNSQLYEILRESNPTIESQISSHISRCVYKKNNEMLLHFINNHPEHLNVLEDVIREVVVKTGYEEILQILTGPQAKISQDTYLQAAQTAIGWGKTHYLSILSNAVDPLNFREMRPRSVRSSEWDSFVEELDSSRQKKILMAALSDQKSVGSKARRM